MTKGFQANKDRIETINSFGKSISKRAGFKCEWCEDNEDLRLWDYRPVNEPNMDTLALLCGRCRELADGRTAKLDELRSIRNAFWSNIPAVAEGAARVLAQSNDIWAREAIKECFIDDSFKTELLK
jgi:protein PhnA